MRTAKKRIPGTSIASAKRATPSRERRLTRTFEGGSGGSQRSAMTSPTATSGTLSAKIPCQPTVPTRMPPRTGPSAATTDETMPRIASATAGASPSGSRFRKMARPDGYAVDVPNAIATRQRTRIVKVGAKMPSAPESPTTTSPDTKVRLGPNRSANRPMRGIAIAAARKKPEMSQVEVLVPAPKAAAMGTSATAIIDELIGLRVVPVATAVIRRALGRGTCSAGRAATWSVTRPPGANAAHRTR